MFLNNSDDPRRPERAPSSQQCDVLFRSDSDSARFTVRFQRHVRHSRVVNSASRRRSRANALAPYINPIPRARAATVAAATFLETAKCNSGELGECFVYRAPRRQREREKRAGLKNLHYRTGGRMEEFTRRVSRPRWRMGRVYHVVLIFPSAE